MKKIILMLVLVFIGVVSAEEQMIKNFYPPVFPSNNPPDATKAVKNRFNMGKHGYYYFIYDKVKHKKIITQSCRFYKVGQKYKSSDVTFIDRPSNVDGASPRECYFRLKKANEIALSGEDIGFYESKFIMFKYDYIDSIIKKMEKIKDKKWHLLFVPFDLDHYQSSKILKLNADIWGYKNGKWIYYTKDLDNDVCRYDINCSSTIKSGGIWFKRKVNDN